MSVQRETCTAATACKTSFDKIGSRHITHRQTHTPKHSVSDSIKDSRVAFKVKSLF